MDQLVVEKIDQLLGKFDKALEVLAAHGADPDRSLTTEEAAAFLAIHKTHLLRYVQGGLIPFHRIGKGFTFQRADLIRFRETFRENAGGTFLGKLITQGK